MAARSFDQILADVSAQSDPQRQTVLNQIADLPNQQSAAESGLNAQKNQAYQDILSGAQQRGLGFSGIPLQEQAKYNATNYAPALANLKSTYANNKATLENTLAGIGQNNYQTALGQFNTENALAEQQRQFDLNYGLQQKQLAAQNAYNNYLGGILNGGSNGGNDGKPAAPDPYANIDKNAANNAIHSLLSTGNVGLIHDTINAITASANNGSLYDKYKLELLNSVTQGNNSGPYNPAYAKLIQQAATYKPPTPKQIAQSNVKSIEKATTRPLWEQLINPLNWM